MKSVSSSLTSTSNAIEHRCDVLIIGSGAAGLSLALKLADHCQVIVLSKSDRNEGSTRYAQGGIAAVFDEQDSIDAHVKDTLAAGAGLCEEPAVRFTAERAKASLEWLISYGVPFDTEKSESGEERFHLTREGGHSHRRILHAADATGEALQITLNDAVSTHPNIHIFERYNAIDLIPSKEEKNSVVGAYVWNRQQEHVEVIRAPFVALATGGGSKVYQYTSNPDVSSGDGIAMAWRAGCRVANMEFNQFHPTCLFHPQARNFLITEALRGEGANLCHADGTRFMHKFDERGDLAPRDVVARAIDYEMKRLGADCMYLDISHKPADFIVKHFPNIYRKCRSLGIDITREPIPVVPAAHYSCGGVMTDFNAKTDLNNVYAIGEVAYTGLHGANRMASNSLLECVVFASAAAEDIIKNLPSADCEESIAPWDESQVSNSDEEVIIQHNWHELRLFMWDYVGIVRTDKRLERAMRRIKLLEQEITEYYSHFRVSNNLLELRNLVTVAELIVRCAMERKESRGLHFNLDYPEQLDNPVPTILIPRKQLSGADVGSLITQDSFADAD
ncbi:L-aspartate oxidase [Alteromonas macleodii]|jgi:L-aspartate oxidase|uniref:L-aspartate oxidase n=2 Tax=Alteromonas macleodii TaxID=28108 RepID=A0A126Q1G6_ALTMA|nr:MULTISPECIES: L-aspartate oxidase [Alteromonas]MEC7080546.1 L-aspartate oxidase [Pseudomonadota bacterium]AFT75255.1 L-aspartate oxidase [Alteromonas macleodii str. 'English Channel 673']AMJ99082.1 L-aspartate oxidase [Alteromonas macleodii]AUI83172.1 L-aspartate oxidase [Alteromonas macleodii]MAL71472.1 L-aspartate oxidase [Alteromonas sp.]|tara:strand:+ start:1731 stop:3416 length:1686 start_codon:yes stop_codon:yes gene_type:complete